MMPNMTFSGGLMKMVTTQPTWMIADDDRVGQRRPSVRGVVAGDPQPERDRRDAHDHVPGDHHAVVEVLALVDRMERRSGSPRASTSTPSICTMVATRKNTSSVS